MVVHARNQTKGRPSDTGPRGLIVILVTYRLCRRSLLRTPEDCIRNNEIVTNDLRDNVINLIDPDIKHTCTHKGTCDTTICNRQSGQVGSTRHSRVSCKINSQIAAKPLGAPPRSP